MLDVVKQAARSAGGIKKLAERLGIRHPSLYDWKKVPAERVLTISELSGHAPHDIRPDIYPDPQATPHEAAP